MLIAEDLLLLTYDDATGKPDAGVRYLDYRIAGALLVELALIGRIDIAGSDGGGPDEATSKPGTVVVLDPSPTGHPALDRAMDVIGHKPRTPRGLVSPLAKGAREPLLAGLVERGILAREGRRILGIFPTTAWPASDSSHELHLRTECQAALLDARPPRPETAALVSVIQGTGLIKKLVPTGQAKVAQARAKELTQQTWAHDAVKTAAGQINAAVMTAVMVPAMTALTFALA